MLAFVDVLQRYNAVYSDSRSYGYGAHLCGELEHWKEGDEQCQCIPNGVCSDFISSALRLQSLDQVETECRAAALNLKKRSRFLAASWQIGISPNH